MIRKFGALLTGFAVAALCVAVDAADEKKPPTIKEVMKAVAAKETGLCGQCAAAAKAEKWEDAQKLAKKMAECASALPKNKCPLGDAESWAKLTKQYAAQAEAVSKAAESKDTEKFNDALKTFTGSCKACHEAHREKKKDK